VTTGSATAPDERLVRYSVFGMDCPDDSALIEKAARTVAGIEDAHVSLASGAMTVRVGNGFTALPALEQAVTGLGFRLDRLDGNREGDELSVASSHITPVYKRALWIVVILNVGYGVIEMAGGLLSGSQAVKADALDFVGDGLISFLGLLAIGWHPIWRARAALIQGLFLGALGLGVLGTTLYRVLVQGIPEAELMGALGLVGFVVNVAAALVLLPHRSGDANVRAVWLFSRNDALGNLAVVIAAVLVALSGTAWPDLVVAFVIAGLFLHSAWSIVTDARNELRLAGAQ
jgi:Co/Zn/Cd efflux system component